MSNGKSHILYYMNREFGSFYIVDFAFTPYPKGASFFVSRLKDCESILKVLASISCALGNVLKSGCTSQTIEISPIFVTIRPRNKNNLGNEPQVYKVLRYSTTFERFSYKRITYF